MMCAIGCALASLLTWGAYAEEKTAPRSRFDLAWTAPAACAPPPDVASLVGDAAGAASVQIEPHGTTWRLTVTWSAPVEGRRTLETGTCEEAAAAANLLLRLCARGMLPAEVPPPPPPQPASPAATGADQAGISPPPLEPSFTVTGFAGAQAFVLPTVAPRFGAQAWLGYGPWNVLVAAATGLPANFPGGPSADAGVELTSVLEAVVAACYAARWPALRLAGCIDFQAAWWRLRGLHVSDPRSGGAALLAAGPASRAMIPVGRHFAVTAGLAIRPTLLRPRAMFAGYGSALEAGPLVGQFDVGVGATW